ncbi:probable transcription factor At1g61730 [Gastrolobium bilobum]|uniref:probable transcription factor At1g61730 n=1 Tax=Gastrolobium bilobum TaxID=150636 RepID=UPI002AB22DC2|nr:probable transcription factor At1g61730 [Gastrolobium bilobum]
MIEFTSKTCSDPLKQLNEFFSFVKGSLQLDASVFQLEKKIRRLKKKFINNVEKGKKHKPHEHRLFELSKNIWASEVAEKEDSNSNSATSSQISKPETNVVFNEMIRFINNGSMLNENVIRGRLELVGESKREELEVGWSALLAKKLELFAKRARLIKDQTRLMLEAHKSSNH